MLSTSFEKVLHFYDALCSFYLSSCEIQRDFDQFIFCFFD